MGEGDLNELSPTGSIPTPPRRLLSLPVGDGEGVEDEGKDALDECPLSIPRIVPTPPPLPLPLPAFVGDGDDCGGLLVAVSLPGVEVGLSLLEGAFPLVLVGVSEGLLLLAFELYPLPPSRSPTTPRLSRL